MNAERVAFEVTGQGVPLPFGRERLIVLAHDGSIAHTTYLPPEEAFDTDDLDVMGVFVPDDRHLLGLRAGWQGETAYAGHVDSTFSRLQKTGRLLLKGTRVTQTSSRSSGCGTRTCSGGLRLRPAPAVSAYDLLRATRSFATRAVYEPFVGSARSQLGKLGGGAYRGYMGARRKGLADRFGSDPKNAAHLIRLLGMATEFLADSEPRI